MAVAGVRVGDIRPAPEVEKALQPPPRERIQQAADEATFQRRAQAVEKERAIQENELQNQIELARREEELISQRGLNDQRRAREEAEAQRIASEGAAQVQRVDAEAQAEAIRAVQDAEVGAERERMEIYRDMPTSALAGLAAREFAGKLERIEHLSLSPDMLGPWLTRLFDAGARRLEAEA